MKNSIFFSAVITLFILSGVCTPFAKAQNLVPNYSFETFTTCPNDYSQLTYATGWMEAPQSIGAQYATEYLHGCSSGNFSTPFNIWGTQTPSHGQGYIAMATTSLQLTPNYRENNYVQLLQPLQVGVSYFLSVKISLTEESKLATNNFGLKFSTVPAFPVNNSDHLHSATVVSDESNWTEITGNFVADSAYTYLCIGNFHNDANTTISTVCNSCPYNHAGYFVDEVCVVRGESGNCGTPVSNLAPSPAAAWQMAVSPNPANEDGFLSIMNADAGQCEIEWMDMNGKVLRSTTLHLTEGENRISFTRGGLPSGIYLVRVSTSGGFRTSMVSFQ